MSRRLLFLSLFLFLCLSASFAAWRLLIVDLPSIDRLTENLVVPSTRILARDGRLLYEITDPAGVHHTTVPLAQIPLALRQATIATEDASFYSNPGVDIVGIVRALWINATGGEVLAGGSTITQQVARQFFLSSEYSYTRKLAEMLLAMKMERELSKDEIFQLYLNKSFFGNRAYGIGAAAEYYYGKSLKQLDLDEMATLASIPKFPSSGNPITNPERARIRRDYVLQRMHELGFISSADQTASQGVSMHATPHERPIEVRAPYIAEMVRQEMLARFGGDVLTMGYHVTTTIDPVLQAAATQAVRDGLTDYDHRHGWNQVEQHFELAPGEDAAAASARLRTIATQGDRIPAIVLRSGDGTADVVLADGSKITLDAASSRWTGRSPSALVQRGDLVRVRRADDVITAAAKAGGDGKAATAPAAPPYTLDQLPRAQSALVSLEPDNGALRALVGGFSFAGNKFNRATQARRQPGSSFKPFLYAAAFERGFNPASIVLDAPVVFKDRRGHLWRPQNDSGNFLGPMRLREALVQSRNLVSVRLLDAIGVAYARRYISHFGIDEALLPPNLSMSLGTASLPPMMMARGYSAFPNGGFRITPWFIDEVRDRNGKVIFKEKPATACTGCGVQVVNGAVVPTSNVVAGFDLSPDGSAPAPKPDGKQTSTPATAPKPVALAADIVLAPRAIDARVAYQLVSMMRDVVLRGTGIAAKVLGRADVAGKTGSTNDHRDAWFSGFGGPYVTTVWVGRDDFRSLGYREYGGKAALPIWIEYMRVALKDKPIVSNDPPDGMVKVAVSAGGQLLPTTSSGGITEYVKAEDLERMENYVDYGPQQQTQDEEAFNIF